MACMRDDFHQGKLLDGRFLTVAPLNRGSFGMVFTAKDLKTGEDVAIKCITKPDAVLDYANCPAAVAIDDRSEELEIHSRLPTHPNIVNLVHNFETKHHQYMVLELCNNGDLYEAIRNERGPLETEHVRALMLELVDAIDHMHSNGVFHRDIKPENIFLTSNGSMKIGDFGLATTETWSTEFAVGSDRYMAPEQFDASVYGYGYSPASADVWAIGIVLLNVLFSRNPFATPTPKDPLFADFVHDRQSLFDVFPNMSQDTYNVITHSLAVDPANRSLGAVREALKAVVSFTTDDETLDEFCTETPTEVAQVATAAREPLRTPSITSPNMSSSEVFPWGTALKQTPQKSSRQLSTIPDNEPDLFPGSYASTKQYGDTDEASLSSQVDSGLGMSYKSAKSIKAAAAKHIVGSLPIHFSRPSMKSVFTTGFSKSWSDLYDEEEELELEFEEQAMTCDAPAAMERVPTTVPTTPQLSEDDRGSATPRPAHAVPALPAHIDDSRTASPLRRLVEEDRANPESTKQRTASIMDRWTALGTRRRAKEDAAVPAVPKMVPPPVPPTPKSKYVDAFTNFASFGASKRQKSRPKTSHDDKESWRQGSPQRLRSTSINRSRVWERKEQSPIQEKWSLDNNWRQHMSPAMAKISAPAQNSSLRSQKPDKTFLDLEFDDGIGDLQFGFDMADDDVEWKGNGWQHDFL